MNWFLYDNGFHHERVKEKIFKSTDVSKSEQKYPTPSRFCLGSMLSDKSDVMQTVNN